MHVDNEIKSIAQVIYNNLPDGEVSQYDAVFTERLLRNAAALKINFWAQHHSWESVLHYPELVGRILDFGCGSGHADVYLARSGRTVTGIDMSRVGIAIARYLRAQEDEPVACRLDFMVADVTVTPPPGRLYDSACASHVFEHIANPVPVLDGLMRWLRPGAHMLITVPLGRAYDDPGHVHHFFSAEQCAAALGPYAQAVVRADIDTLERVIHILIRRPL